MMRKMKAVEFKIIARIGSRGREIWRYMKRLALWARTHFSAAITVVVSMLIGVSTIYYFDFSEPAVRLVGLLFQIVGLFPVAFGIREANRIFGHPTVWASAKEAWRTRPRWNGRPINLSACATTSAFSSSVAMAQVEKVPAERSIQERLEALENNIKKVEQEAAKFKSEANQRFSNITNDINAIKRDHTAKINDISNKLKSLSIDGVGWAIAGLVWIALGIVLSTTSIEIHDAFGASPLHGAGINHGTPALVHRSSVML